ncbi:MAG: ABC transporter ATP-binding protein [Planctomycetaceae bacterium]|nr:ABC transporter ATP-binding protein [Planctomycetaceae bacterium]
MAESSDQRVRKLLSCSSFFRGRNVVASVAALVSALSLALVILASGLLVALIIDSQAGSSAGGDGSSWVDVGTGEGWMIQARSILGHVGFLRSERMAAMVLVVVISFGLLFRWSVRSAAGSMLEREVAGHVQRLRQHVHRMALRLEPADLTGEQLRTTDRLFQESASRLDQSLSAWGKCWLLDLPDLIVVLTVALCVQWRVALETIIPVVLCWFGLRLETMRADASARLLSEQAERGLQRLAEGLRKTRIVTGFGMEKMEGAQFELNLGQYRERCVHLQRQQENRVWLYRIIMLFAILVPGFLLVRHMLPPAGMHPATAGIIIGCLFILFRSLLSLQKTPDLAAGSAVRIEEIGAYIDRVPLVGQIAGASFMEPMSRTLQFNQIVYGTPQSPRLLNNLDLKITFGERVAVVSLNPAAPVALTSMIPRFIDPDNGQVLIDGKDVRLATLESLRAEAVFVGGNDSVFNASVVENITCGQADITKQQVIEACKIVHADRFLRSLPRGYETILGEHGGVVLDAGQVFRLSLARALARKPALLVIEEPRVALDAETKAMLDDAYQRMSEGCTVLFLPFRLSTVKRCDRVVMIHDGRVVADGPHESLVRSNDLYRHWEYTNFNDFRDSAEPASTVQPG